MFKFKVIVLFARYEHINGLAPEGGGVSYRTVV